MTDLNTHDMHTYVHETLDFLYNMVAGTVKDVGDDGIPCKLSFDQRLKAATTLLKVVSDLLVQFDDKPASKDKTHLMLGELDGIKKKVMTRLKKMALEEGEKP